MCERQLYAVSILIPSHKGLLYPKNHTNKIGAMILPIGAVVVVIYNFFAPMTIDTNINFFI